jgi:glycosyltransferase involved in cell wall biosynthesis
VRIALVHSRYSSAVPSGENVVVDAEFRALAAAGVDVELFQTDPDVVRAGRTYPLTAALRVATGRGRALLDDIRSFRPDAVHVHNTFPDLGERDVARLPFPLVTTAHNYRSFCANGYAFRDGHTCTDCVTRTGGSVHAVVHGCFKNPVASLPLAIRTAGGPAANALMQRARRVLVPSRQGRDVLVGAGLAPEKAVVSPHFLPDALVPAAAPDRRRTDAFVFVGRLTAEKGLDPLLARWPADRRLVVVGDGDDRARLAAAHPGDHITFTGQLPREQVLELLTTARALLFTSRWWETFGLVAMEAIAAGTPVVSVGQHAVADLVRDQGVGQAVDHPDELPAALAALEATSPEAWHAAVTAVFRKHFAESAWVQRRLDEYAEACAPVG